MSRDKAPQVRADQAWEIVATSRLGESTEQWVRRKRSHATTYDPSVCVCCGHPVHPEHEQQCNHRSGCDRRDHHFHLEPISWRAIATELEEITGLVISYETLRNRWPDPPDPRRVWGADEHAG
jgi:hypothetical protein